MKISAPARASGSMPLPAGLILILSSLVIFRLLHYEVALLGEQCVIGVKGAAISIASAPTGIRTRVTRSTIWDANHYTIEALSNAKHLEGWQNRSSAGQPKAAAFGWIRRTDRRSPGLTKRQSVLSRVSFLFKGRI